MNSYVFYYKQTGRKVLRYIESYEHQQRNHKNKEHKQGDGWRWVYGLLHYVSFGDFIDFCSKPWVVGRSLFRFGRHRSGKQSKLLIFLRFESKKKKKQRKLSNHTVDR